MAFTKVAAAGISTGDSFVFSDINATGIITASTIKVGSAVTIHTGGYQIGSSNLHSTGLEVQNLDVSGILTAASFSGDGSGLTGVAAAGLGTALSSDQSSSLNNLYYVDQVLSIGSTITVNPPDSSNIAYTNYSEIAVEEGYDLIVEDGDDLVPDILGLSTSIIIPLPGPGGRVRADNFTNKAGTGAPTLPLGVNVTGVVTATSFVGDGSNLTGVSGFASALANSGPLNNVFKTSKTLDVTAGIHTVNSDAASDNIAFMRESIIHVAAGATFHIGSGTTLRTNILNLF